MASITAEESTMRKRQKITYNLVELGILKKGAHYRYKCQSSNEFSRIALEENYMWSYIDKNTGDKKEEASLSSIVKIILMTNGYSEGKSIRNGWEVVRVEHEGKWVKLDKIPGVKENRDKGKQNKKKGKKQVPVPSVHLFLPSMEWKI